MDILLKDQMAEIRQEVRLHLRNIVGIVVCGEKHFERSAQGDWVDVTNKVKDHHRRSFAVLWPDLQRLQGAAS